MRVADEYVYWIVGASNDSPGEIVRLASVIRSVESAGQAVSYGINSTSLRLDAVASINLIQCVIGVVAAWFVVKDVGILPDGTKLFRPPIYATEDDRKELETKGNENVLAKAQDGHLVALTQQEETAADSKRANR